MSGKLPVLHKALLNTQYAIRNTQYEPRLRALAIVGALVLVGAAFSAANAPLVSSAANAVEVQHSDQAAPLDPQSTLWERAKEAEIPLSSQQILQPGGGTTRLVKVRAIEDGHSLAFRVSWADDTRNDTAGNVPSDAAAIQLPMDPTHLPYQCMGQSNNRVNIWQWRAVLEREGLTNLGAEAVQGAGVRNLTSNGICKAVDTPGLEPQVKSFHDGKEWHVVFARALDKGDVGAAPLMVSLNSSVAFAVWNGARGEARGMKAVSTWNTLQFQTPPVNNTANLITLGVVIAVSAGLVAYAMRRMAS
jgi:DMSO reductase family type II enzyme heme b subunit